jgi:hypothetical protein
MEPVEPRIAIRLGEEELEFKLVFKLIWLFLTSNLFRFG